MDDNSIMPFGKYKGKKLVDIPASYFLWLNGQEWCRGEIKEYIKDNMSVFNLELKDKHD